MYKINSIWMTNPPRRKEEINLHYLGLGDTYSKTAWKGWSSSKNRCMDCSRLETLVAWVPPPRQWMMTQNKGDNLQFIFMQKNCTHNIKKSPTTKKYDLNFKRAKNESKHFSLGDLQVANEHREKHSTCPVSREMQIKTKMRCYFSCTGIDFLSTSPLQVITSVDKLQRTRIVTHCCVPCKRTQPFLQDKLARSQTSKQHHHETPKWQPWIPEDSWVW